MNEIVLTILAGLTLGFMASFHCIGMCGPLALALPVYHLGPRQKTTAHLLYNLGRITTYSLLGLLFGTVGRGFYLAGWQQLFSIVIGSIILLLTFMYILFKKNYQPNWLKWFNGYVQKIVGLFLRQKTYRGYFLMGMANGLLPCGMVYMAIAAALVTGNAVSSGLLMAAFGAGTVPAMLLMGIFGSRINIVVRKRIQRLTPFVMILVGCLLILRGLQLGIPYVSPAMAKQVSGAISCH